MLRQICAGAVAPRERSLLLRGEHPVDRTIPYLVITLRIDRAKGPESGVIDQNIQAAEMQRRFVPPRALDIVVVENIQTPGVRVSTCSELICRRARARPWRFIYIGNVATNAPSAANK